MANLKELLNTSNLSKIVPAEYNTTLYNILNATDGQYEITLPPVSFTDFMVGREHEIRDIKSLLAQKKMLVIVNGIGGIGKTSLCKYIFKHSKNLLQRQYNHIAWVDYENNIVSSFIKAFKNLDIPFNPSDTDKEKFDKLIYELNILGEKLLLFIDNVDKMYRSDKGLLKLLQLKCHIVLTSRMNVFDGEYLYPLDFLTDNTCKEIFLKYYIYQYSQRNNEINDCLNKLIRLCGNHALTIELLAKTLNADEVTLKSALSILKNEKFDLSLFKNKITTEWDNRQYEKDVADHIIKVFSISKLTKLQKENLQKLALLSPADISINDTMQLLGLDRRQIDAMTKKGWIINDGKKIKMHRVVKHAICKQRTTRMSKYKFILHNISKMTVWQKKYSELDFLISHAEELLAEFHKCKMDELGTLARNISAYYKYQGNMSLAIRYINKEITIWKNNNNPQEMTTAQKNKASLYLELGQPQKALKILIDVIHTRKNLYPLISLEIAECYANIGYAYQEMGEYKNLLNNYKKALGIRIKIDGIEGTITAWSYNNLAMAYALIYDYQKALEYSNKAITIRTKVAHKTNSRKDQALLDVAQSTSIQGFILTSMKEYTKAAPILKDSMDIRRKYLGKDHVITATAMQRYALNLCMLNKLDKSYNYINDAIEIYKKNTGDITTDMAIAYNTLGIIECFRGNQKNAEHLQKRAIHIYNKIYSSKHPRLLQMYEDIAFTYEHFERYEEALTYYNKALEIGNLFLYMNNWKIVYLSNKINEILQFEQL